MKQLGKKNALKLFGGMRLIISVSAIGLASDDVKKLSNAWQRGKLVLNKDRVPYKSMLGKKSLTGRSSLSFVERSERF